MERESHHALRLKKKFRVLGDVFIDRINLFVDIEWFGHLTRLAVIRTYTAGTPAL